VFEAGLEISAHILAVLPAAVVGLISGVLGIGFVLLNIKVTRLRDALLSRYKWRRCIEPCVLVVAYVTGTMLLPRLFPCTPTHCVTYNQQVYCGIQNVTAAAQGSAPPANTPPLSLPLYTCAIVSEDTNTTWIPSSGSITPDTPTNGSAIVYYNELATLMLNTGVWDGWGRGLAWGGATATLHAGDRPCHLNLNVTCHPCALARAPYHQAMMPSSTSCLVARTGASATSP
jgi:chloride channel 7